MNQISVPLAIAALLLAPLPSAGRQAAPERLPAHLFDVTAPGAWVRGAPGEMSVVPRQCRSLPAEGLRRRIVEVAVQEWAFFGFPVLDRLNGARLLPPGVGPQGGSVVFENTTRRAPGLNARESERVAGSIAGYWAVTPEGRGVVQEQNRLWNSRGVDSRWNAPWSAAFISWVMCEGGLGTNERFRRAVAHWTYVDQAIRARDGQAPQAAFEAYDIGERAVEPGDLLCLGRRPAYRSLAERRRQMGAGASSHCDIVVAVDVPGERILAIGGNVLRSVSLKVLPADRDPAGGMRARSTSGVPLFAHLRLRADPIRQDALADSPVLAAFACPSSARASSRGAQVLAQLRVEGPWSAGAGGGAIVATADGQGEMQGAGVAAPPTC
jgi:hypothetical protein